MKNINRKKEYLLLLPMFEKFIAASKNGRRVQPNGKRISPGSIKNYNHAVKLISSFCQKEDLIFRIRPVKYLTKREMLAEKKYWETFYQRFTNFLYKDRGHFDNYVGQTIKIVRTFFNYLNKDLMMGIGDFHKLFFVRKEDLSVLTLMPEELNFLIYDSNFHDHLPVKLKSTKKIFVFGCTVALRFSDLMALRKSNLRKVNERWYLVVQSKKTSTETLIRLPDYAITILKSFKRRDNKLLPPYSLSTLNDHIKLICERAGFTQPVNKVRSVRGKPIQLKNIKMKADIQFRFCDLASSHTMRRTAITTMLCLGVPELVVRKISGHSPMSKEFFRYISLAQSYQDNETGKMFEMLKERRLVVGAE